MALAVSPLARGEQIVPTHDDQVIETLPGSAQSRGEQRRIRLLLTAKPGDARVAIKLARRELEQAKDAGDPRFAGLSLAALARWGDPSTAPSEVLLVRANVQQYLHQFGEATATLHALLSRPDGSALAQGWLTLATILRVQGHYAKSDEACRQVLGLSAEVYGRACIAENAGLRGELGSARSSFRSILATQGLTPQLRSWVLVSVAELEQRCGDPRMAEESFRQALQFDDTMYGAVAFADFLLDQRRPAEAADVLEGRPKTDPVLLRQAIAKQQLSMRTPVADAEELRARIALANLRPDARVLHGREQSMFFLLVDNSPNLALDIAKDALAKQREPIDLFVLARSAKAAGDANSLAEVKALKRSLGLCDKRIDAIL